MDNPANMDEFLAELRRHATDNERLKKEREELNAQAFAASGLAKGDIISFRDTYYGDILAEVDSVFLVYSVPWREPDEDRALIKVRGWKLTKAGKRHASMRAVSCYLQNATLVRKAGG